jgi:L-asparaginase II
MVRRRRREPLLHNCSGKHAGMLLACARSGWDVASYVSARHPLQRRILRTVRRASGVDDPVVGVDGCGVPVHGVPLRAMATLYARLARPDRLGDVAPCVARATEAMLAEPYLVGGRRRSDTAIMRETGDVVAKSGAEALECAAAIGPGTGVAVKVEDGGYRAAAPAVVAVLSQLGLLTDAAREALVPFAAPGVTGGGRRIGELRAVVRLRRER